MNKQKDKIIEEDFKDELENGNLSELNDCSYKGEHDDLKEYIKDFAKFEVEKFIQSQKQKIIEKIEKFKPKGTFIGLQYKEKDIFTFKEVDKLIIDIRNNFLKEFREELLKSLGEKEQ
jgi:hypothetical protein